MITKLSRLILNDPDFIFMYLKSELWLKLTVTRIRRMELGKLWILLRKKEGIVPKKPRQPLFPALNEKIGIEEKTKLEEGKKKKLFSRLDYLMR